MYFFSVCTQLLWWLCHWHLRISHSLRLVAVDSAGPDIVLACSRSIYSLGVWGTRNFEGRAASYKIALKTAGVVGFGWAIEHWVRLVLAIPVPEMPRTFLVWSWWMSWCADGREDWCVDAAGTVCFLFCSRYFLGNSCRDYWCVNAAGTVWFSSVVVSFLYLREDSIGTLTPLLLSIFSFFVVIVLEICEERIGA